MLVCVREAPIVLFLERVFRRVRDGITSRPESFDELIALFFIGELLEVGAFLVGNDPADILIEPFAVGVVCNAGRILGAGWQQG